MDFSNVYVSNMYEYHQQQMISEHLIARGIKDPLVIKAMSIVPRHLFVPEELKEISYSDSPLPIGYYQTISQPYIVAFMTEAAKLTPDSKVLEIGTGSGYQAAVLSLIAKEIYSIEVLEPLAKEAMTRFDKLKYNNIYVKIGDGFKGWKEKGPFDVIILTAAPEKLPQTLVDQLKPGGTIIAPIGRETQELIRYTKTDAHHLKQEILMPVRFVPMVSKDK
jgi:protein-L-isoaspartate(D-aspartate) O-methyltransferase